MAKNLKKLAVSQADTSKTSLNPYSNYPVYFDREKVLFFFLNPTSFPGSFPFEIIGNSPGNEIVLNQTS